MSSVDQRIVEMKFDNGQFEKGVAETSKTLEALKKGLNPDSLKGLGDAAGKFNLGPVGDAVEGVSAKFAALATIGITALANITNRAIDAGIQMAKSLTLQPIMDGFAEYELKMGSIQTILANTQRHGSTLNDVSKSLDELNKYADETIYNFGQMTNAIGQMTVAGLDLETSTMAVKGFSNVAAVTGTDAGTMARGMVQLSEAMQNGTFRLIDFRTTLGKAFSKDAKDSIIKIADQMGKFEGSGTTADAAMQNFNASLEKGWLSADVMSTYLKIMTGDMTQAQVEALGFDAATSAAFIKQAETAKEAATKVRTFTQLVGTIKESVGSAWGGIFETLIGDFEEATKLWSGLNDAIGPMFTKPVEGLNTLLEGWKKLGGQTIVIESIVKLWKNLQNIFKAVGDAWKSVFPPATAQTLLSITKGFASFVDSLMLGKGALNGIQQIFKIFFSVLNIGWQILKGVFAFFSVIFSGAQKTSGGILSLVGSFAELINKGLSWITQSQIITKFFIGLATAIRYPVMWLSSFVQWVAQLVSGLKGVKSSGADKTLDNMSKSMSVFERIGLGFRAIGEFFIRAWQGFLDILKKVWAFFKPVAVVIGNFFKDVGKQISAALNFGDFNSAVQTILSIFQVGLLGGLLLMFQKGSGLLKQIKSSFKDGFKFNFDFGSGKLKEAMEGLTGILGGMQAKLKAEALKKIAVAIAILAGSVLVLSFVDPKRLISSLSGLTVMMSQMLGFMAIFQRIPPTAFGKMGVFAASIAILSGAMGLLAISVAKLSKLSWEELARGLSGVIVLLAAIVGVSRTMKNPGKLILTATGMVILASAIKILSSSVSSLGSMSWEQLAKGISGVTVVLGAVTGMTHALPKNPVKIIASGVAMVLIGQSMKTLADALKSIGKLSWESILKGLTGMGVALGLVSAALKFIKPSDIVGSAALYIAIQAIQNISKPLQALGKMTWGSIGKSMASLAGALLLIVAALKVIKPTDIVGAAALWVAIQAVQDISGPLQDLGGMSWNSIAKSLAGLLGALAIIAAALIVIPPSAVIGAASLFVAIKAVEGITPALKEMGKLSWGEIGKGMVVLGGSLLILAVGLTAMMFSLPGAVALGVATAALSGLVLVIKSMAQVKWGDFWKFLGMIAIGLTAIGIAGILLIPAIPGLIGLGVAMALIGAGVALLGTGLAAIAAGLLAIGTAGPVAVEGLKKVLTTFIEMLPLLGQKFAEMLTTFIVSLAENSGKIAAAFTELLLSLLDSINEIIPKAIDVFMNLISEMLTALSKRMPEFTNKGIDIIIKFTDGVASRMPEISKSAANLITQFLRGLSNNMDGIIREGTNVIIKFIEGVGKNSARLADAAMRTIVTFVEDLSTSIDNNSEAMGRAGGKLAGSLISGLVKGIGAGVSEVVGAAGRLAQDAFNGAMNILQGHSPSRLFMYVGDGVIDAGLAIGMRQGTGQVIDASEEVGRTAVTAMRSSFRHLADVIEHDMDSQPVIRPVLDLSQIQEDAHRMDRIFLDNALPVSGQFATAASIAEGERIQKAALANQNGSEISRSQGVTFIQNNNSPKALSTAEIYRQTKNQISQIKKELPV